MGILLRLFIHRLCSEKIIDFVIYNYYYFFFFFKSISNTLASSITFHLYENHRCIYSKMLSFVMIRMPFILMTFNCQVIKLLRKLCKLDFATNAVCSLVYLKNSSMHCSTISLYQRSWMRWRFFIYYFILRATSTYPYIFYISSTKRIFE